MANVDANVRFSLLAALAATSTRVTIDSSKTPVAYIPADLFELTLAEVGLSDDTQMTILKNSLKVLLPGIAAEIDQLPNNPGLRVGGVAQFLVASARASVK